MDLGDYQNIVASNIKEIRNKEELTQEQFASSLEEERSTISNWETAKAQPALQQLLKIYKVFNVSLDEICNITKKKESVIIIDSSILIRRPFILYELRTKKIDHIEIPKCVIDSLEETAAKDKTRKGEQAKIAKQLFFQLEKEHPNRFSQKSYKKDNDILDDEIIIKIAKSEANIYEKVYLLSEDIYYGAKENKDGFSLIKLKDYDFLFNEEEVYFNLSDTNSFYTAVIDGNLEKVKEIAKRKPDINYINEEDGYTPLIASICEKNKEMFDLLLSLNVNIDKIGKEETPMIYCVDAKDNYFLTKLLEKGADIDRINYLNKQMKVIKINGHDSRLPAYHTALQYALNHNKKDIFKLLINNKANCDKLIVDGYIDPELDKIIKENKEIHSIKNSKK